MIMLIMLRGICWRRRKSIMPVVKVGWGMFAEGCTLIGVQSYE